MYVMTKKHKKGEKQLRNLIGGQARVCLSGVSIKHKKGKQHKNLMGDQTRFSQKKGDDIAARDVTSVLPVEILCYIVSLLPLREAVRTSILARRWKYLWRSSLNLNFDVKNFTGDDYQHHDHSFAFTDWIYTRCGTREAMLLKKKEWSFVTWVNQLLELHDSGKIESCKIDFPVDVLYSDHVDRWIQNLASKGVERLDFISYFDLSRSSSRHYRFPHWLFGRVEGRSSLKHLALTGVVFNPTCNMGNLISLTIQNTCLTQENVDNILDCAELEAFTVNFCFFSGERLKIARKNSNLKLKHLNISYCNAPMELEICGAKNFSSLECRGSIVHRISFKDSATPFKLWHYMRDEVEFTYGFRQLALDFPQLRTLSLYLEYTDLYLHIKKGWCFFQQLRTFNQLRDLVLLMPDMVPESVLELTTALLKAAPLLHSLELHLPRHPKEIGSKRLGKLLQWKLIHANCLKKVKILNFQGAPTDVQIASYLLRSATGLESMTIIRGRVLYAGDGIWMEDSHFLPKITRKQVRGRLLGDVPSGARLIVL